MTSGSRAGRKHVSQSCIYATAHELVDLISSRVVSSRDVVTEALERIEAVQPQLNCMAEVRASEALAAADQADAAVARSERIGPLHGVPITIKDGIAAAGHRQTFGSASRSDRFAVEDDEVCRRLRGAGAILLGTTTAPEYFHKVVTDSPLFGVTRNPWALDRTPGGSSGGAASALSAGIGAIAIGSDGGGSIRLPAACTGLLGLKPTMGRIPHVNYPDSFGNYAVLGPLARSVTDLTIALEVMAGSDRADAASLGVPPFEPDVLGKQKFTGFRIGAVKAPGGHLPEPDVANAFSATLDILSSAGADVVDTDGTCLAGIFEAYLIISSVGYAAREREEAASDQNYWSSSFKSVVTRGLSYSASELERAQEVRTTAFRSVQGLFESFDVIATPTITAPAYPVEACGAVGGEIYESWAAPLYPFNLTGHPAISVPCGYSAIGLPVGIQFVAPWYEERRLIRLAATLEALRPWDWRGVAI